MEIILLIGYVPLVVWLFSQSVMLAKYNKIVSNQKQVITALSDANNKLRPFQVWIATLRGSDSPHAPKPSMSNVGGGVYNSIIKKEGH